MPIIGSVLGTVRIVVDESRCLRVLFRDVSAQVFSKKGKGGGEEVLFLELFASYFAVGFTRTKTKA